MKEKIEVDRCDVLKRYRKAVRRNDMSVINELEYLFGVETFNTDVTEQIESFEDACNELGEDHPLVKQYDSMTANDKSIITYAQLVIICAALNEGYEPDFCVEEERYLPYFCRYTEQVYSRLSETGSLSFSTETSNGYVLVSMDDAIMTNNVTFIPHNLFLKSKELAVYCGKKFIKLWATFLLG